MTLQLVRIEEGLCSGGVIFSEFGKSIFSFIVSFCCWIWERGILQFIVLVCGGSIICLHFRGSIFPISGETVASKKTQKEGEQSEDEEEEDDDEEAQEDDEDGEEEEQDDEE